MRIGIDARPLTQQRTGVGNYVYGLVQQLAQLAPEHEYFLYSNRPLPEPLPQPYARRYPLTPFARVPGSLWLLARVGRIARRDHLDVFWSTASILPPWIPDHVLKIVTVYDLVWCHFPETMQKRNLWFHRLHAEHAIRHADRIIVISQSTGDDVARHYGVSPHRIRLVYPAVSEAYQPLDPLPAAQYISHKYSVPVRYMAAVGTVEPRKNLALLIRTLRILKHQRQLDRPLLIAGANGWRNSSLHCEVLESGLNENEIRFLGYIPDEDLPFFYAGASVFLFPSLYEGFGIPPVEAMACGTPVIASNARPMPEVLADAAILESPASPEHFARAIVRVLSDDHLRCTLRARGLQRVQAFRPQRSAQQLLNALCLAECKVPAISSVA